MNATDYEIGKQFKKAALMYHPDKIGDKVTKEDRQNWLVV